MEWRGQVAHFPSSRTECVYSSVAKTDSGGTFTFPSWRSDKRDLIKSSVFSRWYVYKIGTEVETKPNNDFSDPGSVWRYPNLVGRIDDDDEWILTVLRQLPSGCFGESEALDEELAFHEGLLAAIESLPNGKKPIQTYPGYPFLAPRKMILHRICSILELASKSNPSVNLKSSVDRSECLSE